MLASFPSCLLGAETSVGWNVEETGVWSCPPGPPLAELPPRHGPPTWICTRTGDIHTPFFSFMGHGPLIQVPRTWTSDLEMHTGAIHTPFSVLAVPGSSTIEHVSLALPTPTYLLYQQHNVQKDLNIKLQLPHLHLLLFYIWKVWLQHHARCNTFLSLKWNE